MIWTFLIVLQFATVARAQQHGWVKAAQLGGLTAVDFTNSLSGVAGGPSACYYTTDGGRSWQQSTRSGPAFTPYAIAMLDSEYGWSAGWIGGGQFNGGIAFTSNGGISWTTQLYTSDREYLGVGALTRTNVIVSGGFAASGVPDTGKMVQTTNGGKQLVNGYIPRQV